jgi:chemotaxis protein CheX
MEQILYQVFTQAMQNVLSSMAGIQIKPYKPGSDENISTFVTGTMGLTGTVTASVSISFSKQAVDAIHQAIFSDEKEVSFSSIGDLVGEVSNMVWGYARKLFSDKGLAVDASIPTVVLGDRQHLHSASGSVSKVIPFDFDGKKLFIEITMRK